MGMSLYESARIEVSTEPTEINTAVIAKVTLGAAPGDADYPNRVTLQMMGYHSLTGNDNADCLSKVVDYVVNRENRPITRRGKRDRDRVNNYSHPTDMSLKYNKPCHLVLHLDDSLAWCFARDFRPFSRDTDCIFKDVFQNAQLIDSNGGMHPIKEDGTGAISGCRFATMIFDPTSLGESDQNGGRKNFVARFNLNLELLDNPNSLDVYVPIILDPDVRWPGGDGP